MPVTSTPAWNAPRSGILGDAAAIAGSAQINQFLGTHAAGLVYQGTRILTPNGTGGTAWEYPLGTYDMSQPFTMSGTTVGRAAIPLLPVGQGADLLVSLCSDSAGRPGTVITQTRIPASWIYQLAAVSGIASGDSATTQSTGNPLALAQFNSLHAGVLASVNWPYPTASAAGPNGSAIGGTFGNYFFQIGGNPGGAGTLVNSVFTIGFDSAGTVSQAVPQPAFPTIMDASGAAAVTVDADGNYTLVQTGGSTGGTTVLNSTYTATPSVATGNISAWSSQAALPTTLHLHGMAASGPYVYVIGGERAAGAFSSAVYYAQVQNGQISAWNTTSALPHALAFPFVAAIDGFVYVAGGFDGSSQLASVYYAAVNADGSLGPWRPGPSLPAPDAGATGTAALALGGSAIVFNGGPPQLVSLGVTTAGPDLSWQATAIGGYGSYVFGAAAGAAGQWQYYGLYETSFATLPVTLTPTISVPLPATGLTNGATYHVLLQQQGGDLNNYLRTHTDVNVFPGNPRLLTSSRGAYAWSAAGAGQAVPIQVFDQAGPAAPGIMPWHSWEDNGARVTTVVCATTPDQRLLGLCEAVAQSSAQNSNTGFEAGLSPWAVTGGTAARSAGEVFNGGFAAQVTPSGTASVVYLQSELLTCMPGQRVGVEAHMWFTNAVTGNASASVNWFNLAGAYLSTSSNNMSVAAATWTDLVNTFTAPAGAYFYTLTPALSGTPAASNVFYVDAVRGYPATVGPQLSTVTEITYPGTYPSGTYPPLASTVLA